MSHILACREFNEKKSAKNIADKLLSIFEEFDIAGKVWMMETDGAKNMIKLEADLNKLSYMDGKVIV